MPILYTIKDMSAELAYTEAPELEKQRRLHLSGAYLASPAVAIAWISEGLHIAHGHNWLWHDRQMSIPAVAVAGLGFVAAEIRKTRQLNRQLNTLDS